MGRGSDAPFEQIGAPWLDSAAVLARMRAAALPGVRFEGIAFTPHAPGDGKYGDTSVVGIRLRMTNRDVYDPTATAVHLLAAVRAVHPDRFEWIAKHFDRLAGGPILREQFAVRDRSGRYRARVGGGAGAVQAEAAAVSAVSGIVA